MNKLDSKYQSLAVSSTSQPDPSIRSGQRPEPARRLIVLVPSPEVDLAAATHRVWELANATNAHVQFLSLYSDPSQEPSLRRELITMSAMVKDGRVSAEADVLFGKDWVDVVKAHSQAGDMVVCFAEQSTGFPLKPLSQILQADLDISLYILSDLYPRKKSRSNWLAQIASWMGSIVIIIGFFVLQIKIDQLTKDWAHITLLLLSIPFEIWMLWVWNSLFEQNNKK